MQKYLFGEFREVVWFETRDSSGMFDWTVGVIRENDKYRSFVQTGFGGGGMGACKADQQSAENDIDRLWNKV